MLVLMKKDKFQESMSMFIQTRCKAGQPLCSMDSRDFQLFKVQILNIICCNGTIKKVVIMCEKFQKRLSKVEYLESKLQQIHDVLGVLIKHMWNMKSEEDVGPLNSPLFLIDVLLVQIGNV